MGRIDHPNSQPLARLDRAAEKRLAEASNAIDIAQGPEQQRQPANYLARLRNIQRRPPALPLVSNAPQDNDAINTIVVSELSRLSEAELSEFEFAVAELAWRLEGPVTASTDPALHDGHALLSQTARMFEHLHLLQTGSET